MRYLLFALLAFTLPAQSAFSQRSIFLVRHGEKASGDGVDARDPELSSAGRERAEALATMLRDARISAVYATEFKRSRETAEPTARVAGVRISEVQTSETESLIAQLKEAPGNALVVGHSNTLPVIIQALAGGEPIHIEESEYDNLFVLISGPIPQLLRLHFSPPGREGG